MNSKSITEHGRIGEMQDLVNDCIHGGITNLERTEQLSGVRTRAVDIAFLCEKATVLFTAVNKIIPVDATFPQDIPSAAMRERVNRIHLLIAELYRSSFLFLKSRYQRWHSLHKKHQVDVRANMLAVLPKLAQ